ncbi:hypothetical protein BV898_15588 [Hypsibius exemplaris]|uniref:Hexosyltransferase n=1 Tax=Hypsibius exemplaris TaxID=2072580 RepID=A0A9X6NDB7_HYPEX|nr:hypothetical protein BV898_15588 [Hypsibius exemplaris]
MIGGTTSATRPTVLHAVTFLCGVFATILLTSTIVRSPATAAVFSHRLLFVDLDDLAPWRPKAALSGTNGLPVYAMNGTMNGLLTGRPQLQVLDAFCADFTNDPTSDFYLNYTAHHLHFSTYTNASTNQTGRYHFAINSAPGHFPKRRTIRATWKRKLVLFPFRFPSILRREDPRPHDLSTALLLRQEFAAHPEDMVLIEVCDAYENLPLKVFNMMRFTLATFPLAEYVVKMDDDVVPNLPLFYHHFPGIVIKTPDHAIFGLITRNNVSDHGTYRISRSRFAGTTYPWYAHGPAYAIRTAVLPSLLKAAEATPVLNLEDVWLTGLSADRANVKRMKVNRFVEINRGPDKFDESARVPREAYFFRHNILDADVRRVWRSFQRQNCDNL